MPDNFVLDESQIKNGDDLRHAIHQLEKRRLLLEDDLKSGVHNLLEGLRPVNIIRNTIDEVQRSTELKHNLVKVVLGLAAGYLSGKLIAVKSAGIFKKALGTALQFGITHFIAKKKDWQDNGNLPTGQAGGYTKNKSLLRRILSF